MESEATDWQAWSREAVQLMQERNREWQSRFALGSNRYFWDMDSASIVFEGATEDVQATICVVGTTSAEEGTFMWAWANESIPEGARRRLDAVREFGERNGLPLLTEPESPADRQDGIELLAAAGRILDAEGAFVGGEEDVTCYLLLFDFRTVAKDS